MWLSDTTSLQLLMLEISSGQGNDITEEYALTGCSEPERESRCHHQCTEAKGAEAGSVCQGLSLATHN